MCTYRCIIVYICWDMGKSPGGAYDNARWGKSMIGQMPAAYTTLFYYFRGIGDVGHSHQIG